MNNQNQSQIQQIALDVLGNGAYGVVKQVQISTHLDSNNVFAAKEVNKANLKTQEDKQSIQRESEVFEAISKLRKNLKSNGHCYLLCCYQIQSSNDIMNSKTTFLMQQAYLGDLQQILSAFQKLPPQFVKYLLAQLILALEQLHMLGYVHRDLKPGNIMLDRDGNLLLGDFGTARRISDAEMQVVCGKYSYTELIQIQQHQQSQQTMQQGQDINIPGVSPQTEQQMSEELLKQYKTMSFVGTINYIAPEALKLGINAIQNQNQMLINQLCVPLDVWAFGCIAYELATGHKFIESDELTGNTKTQRTNYIRGIEDRDLQNLILKCLKTDPLQRFSGAWAGFKKSKYFTGVDFDSLHQTPLLNVLQTQLLLQRFQLTGIKLTQQLPLIDPSERIMYQKYKQHLLQHEIIICGLEQITVTLDSINYRKATLLVTDNGRLILLNNKTDMVVVSIQLTPWNVSLNCNVYSSDQRSKEVFEPQWEPVRQPKHEILQDISQIDQGLKCDYDSAQLSSKTSTKLTGQNNMVKQHNIQSHQNDNITTHHSSIQQKVLIFPRDHHNSIVNDGQLYQAQPITLAIKSALKPTNTDKIIYLYVKLNEQAKTSSGHGALQYFKFFSYIQKNFTQNKCYGYTFCNNCKQYGLMDDICVACGIQNPQIQKQHGSLIAQPAYFTKIVDKKVDLVGKYQTDHEASRCQLSSYLLRKNRLFVSRDEFKWIYENMDTLKNAQPLPNVFQLARQATSQDLSTKPMLSGLTAKQHRLRKLLVKTYLFRKQQNVGDDAKVLPRVLALFGDDITRHSEELLVLIERTYRSCVGTKLNLYLMETHKYNHSPIVQFPHCRISESGAQQEKIFYNIQHEFVNVIALKTQREEIDF